MKVGALKTLGVYIKFVQVCNEMEPNNVEVEGWVDWRLL